MLTLTAAKELGRALRFLRHAGSNTLRDVAKRSELSAQYVQNIERGERLNASEDAFARLAHGYGVPLPVIQGLVLKARVLSALEKHGIDADGQTFIWRGIEQRLDEIGVNARTDIVELVADMIR